MDGPGDQELISGCLQGDAASWREFVGRFSRLVHWSIRRTLETSAQPNKEELARELFQEFFERLLERNELSRLREAQSLRKFLTVIACHLTLDRLKSLTRQSRKNASLEAMSEEGADLPGLMPELPDEVSGLLRQALQELSPKERACVLFHYEEGKTHGEIGKLLGMPENSVSTVIRRTREKLRQKLEEKGYEA